MQPEVRTLLLSLETLGNVRRTGVTKASRWFFVSDAGVEVPETLPEPEPVPAPQGASRVANLLDPAWVQPILAVLHKSPMSTAMLFGVLGSRGRGKAGLQATLERMQHAGQVELSEHGRSAPRWVVATPEASDAHAESGA
jgi:hypothetical protein